MRKSLFGFPLSPLILLLTGCSAIGDKSASISVIYGITALLALLLLVGYCRVRRDGDPWFLLLFISVLVVNTGYLALAVSDNLQQALWANRLSYLGSVFLPLSMFMIILKVTNIPYRKWLVFILAIVAAIVFLIAATPGFCGIYYKEVYFQTATGVASLRKVYGPLHGSYLFYLLGYFTAMIAVIAHATIHKKTASTAYAVILAIAVFVNIGVWLIEQLAHIDFEMLSISYIISESFLLGLHLMMTESKKLPPEPQPLSEAVPVVEDPSDQDPYSPAQIAFFRDGVAELTPKEQQIYHCYIAGMRGAQIMEQLNIKENTLKFHNKNLYSKLGVNSRKQLIMLYQYIHNLDP